MRSYAYRSFAISLGLACFAALVSTCAVEPDNPGSCSLKCNKAVIGSGDYTIESMSPGVNYRCPPGSGAAGAYADTTVQFKIVKKVGTGDGAEVETTVPNVSIRPVVLGLVDTSFGEGSYKGVITPVSDFCSDACGVVTVTVRGLCPSVQESELSIGIVSGALTTKEYMKVTFQSETEEDEEEEEATP